MGSRGLREREGERERERGGGRERETFVMSTPLQNDISNEDTALISTQHHIQRPDTACHFRYNVTPLPFS